VETRRPYHNTAVTSVISVFYMTRHADIMSTHQNQFAPMTDGYTDFELPDAMITAAATAVSTSLYIL